MLKPLLVFILIVQSFPVRAEVSGTFFVQEYEGGQYRAYVPPIYQIQKPRAVIKSQPYNYPRLEDKVFVQANGVQTNGNLQSNAFYQSDGLTLEDLMPKTDAVQVQTAPPPEIVVTQPEVVVAKPEVVVTKPEPKPLPAPIYEPDPVVEDTYIPDEVVSAPAEEVEYVRPRPPKPRPDPEPVPEPSPEIVAPIPEDKPDPQPEEITDRPQTPRTFDIPDCKYGQNCWRNKSFKEEVASIVSNTAFVNSLHDTHISKNFMVCMSWRESGFNPGAINEIPARGMYQVTPGTARPALRVASKIPEFMGLSSDQYLKKMVTSTVAQTEMSILAILVKVREGASNRIKDGGATAADYKELAWRYVGKINKPYATGYRDAMDQCYKCMDSSKVLDNPSKYDSAKTKECLAKAKK